ncbi:MAG: Mediator of RNA polymerase II transcription subunit 17, variant 2 [Marteilia pararefringens]
MWFNPISCAITKILCQFLNKETTVSLVEEGVVGRDTRSGWLTGGSTFGGDGVSSTQAKVFAEFNHTCDSILAMNSPEFHTFSLLLVFLHKLRKKWVLKLIGDRLLGDLSFRSMGSSFLYDSIFSIDIDRHNWTIRNFTLPKCLQSTSTLKISYIRNNIVTGQTYLSDSKLPKRTKNPLADSSMTQLSSKISTIHYEEQCNIISKRLLQAQHNYLCIEIFEQLVHEVRSLKNCNINFEIDSNCISIMISMLAYV